MQLLKEEADKNVQNRLSAERHLGEVNDDNNDERAIIEKIRQKRLEMLKKTAQENKFGGGSLAEVFPEHFEADCKGASNNGFVVSARYVPACVPCVSRHVSTHAYCSALSLLVSFL